MKGSPLRVSVIDIQPIMPAVGGGRQRLLGLYHALGGNIEATYIGSYDWPGESGRDQMLTPGLREVLVPLTPAHHEAAAALSASLGGRTVIDVAFPSQAHLSPAFIARARQAAASADVIVFSHPWCYPAVADALSPLQRVVYDSQNVESVLRTELLAGVEGAEDLLRSVVEAEYRLCRESHLVLTCSHEDRASFNSLFEVPWQKLRVVPNGIFAHPSITTSAQKGSDSDERIILFLGSNYGPNVRAAKFVSTELAPSLPDSRFLLIGGCCDALAGAAMAPNVELLGVVDEATKSLVLRRAYLAVNPLEGGSGTSIKMFDFMSAGLPVITTDVGARGITYAGECPFRIEPLVRFADAIRELSKSPSEAKRIGRAARRTVEDFYAWERISPALGTLLGRLATVTRPVEFTVVVPTYERHEHLERLMSCLERQRDVAFEVIVVDQSAARWPGASQGRGFSLWYVHTPVRGAVKARNLGGMLALGKCIAFTDDDCLPLENWLVAAREVLEDPDVAGLEGLVRSDHLDDPDWRSVTNVGFEGLGFMTANLFVRNEAFQALNGFDVKFDDPHFREDTDFGWRLQGLGKVPYAHGVEVFHPAHKRDTTRESSNERGRYFEKDALLLHKHPERYRQLFYAEGHYRGTPGFWRHLVRGLEKYGIAMPRWMKSELAAEQTRSAENV